MRNKDSGRLRRSSMVAAAAAWLAAPAAGQLPPEIELDRLLRQAEQAVEWQDPDGAASAMEMVLAHLRDAGIEPAPEDHFRHARVWSEVGDWGRVGASLTEYLGLRGRDADHYREALELLNRAESYDPAFDTMEFVWVPPGEFRMGSRDSEADTDERPRARITRGFWLGKYEVTQAEWEAVMGHNPSWFSNCRRCPVERVSWEDVQEFLRRVNEEADEKRYRLPTEAEWEYAARAGTTGDRYSSELEAIAWYDENSSDRTRRVGLKRPNAWGLYDMLGNVWEWVQDWYGDYPEGMVTDPQGPESGEFRVCRGGAWAWGARAARSPHRFAWMPGERLPDFGFRLVRTP